MTEVEVLDAGTRNGCTATLNAGGPLGAWRVEERRAIGLSLADSTRRSSNRAVTCFEDFRNECRYPQHSPPTIEQLMHFYITLEAKGLSVKSTRGHLAAISFWAKSEGFSDCPSKFRIRKMLEGWNRETSVTEDNRQPISPQVLSGHLHELDGICKSKYEDRLLCCNTSCIFLGAEYQ